MLSPINSLLKVNLLLHSWWKVWGQYCCFFRERRWRGRWIEHGCLQLKWISGQITKLLSSSSWKPDSPPPIYNSSRWLRHLIFEFFTNLVSQRLYWKWGTSGSKTSQTVHKRKEALRIIFEFDLCWSDKFREIWSSRSYKAFSDKRRTYFFILQWTEALCDRNLQLV